MAVRRSQIDQRLARVRQMRTKIDEEEKRLNAAIEDPELDFDFAHPDHPDLASVRRVVKGDKGGHAAAGGGARVMEASELLTVLATSLHVLDAAALAKLQSLLAPFASKARGGGENEL